MASAALWLILFGAIIVDSNDKLQSAFRLIPPRLAQYLPALYGTFAFAALILLHLAHADDLEALRSAPARQPIVEPEAVFIAAQSTGAVYVTNVGDDVALDVAIGPIAAGRVSFGVIRTLKANEPKVAVPVFFLGGNDTRNAPAALSMELVLAKQLNKLGRKSYAADPVEYRGAMTPVTMNFFPDYVPICLTYSDRAGRSYHTHGYVFAEISTGPAPIDYRIVIRPRDTSEAAWGAASAHVQPG